MAPTSPATGALRLEDALAAWAARSAPLSPAAASDVAALVLVEGESDRVAVREAARLLGLDLQESRIAVVPMGGAMSVRRYVAAVQETGRSLRIRGLCDAGEIRFYERAGLTDVHVCRPDLEGELIAALGIAATEDALEGERDLQLFRRFQRQPAQRGRAVEEQLHRFLGTTSGRKEQYARVLTSALPPERVPTALRGALGM
ncbi:hypothetical protein P5G50_02450 [Leifsonia sp. F6_8S_P_1B]|uniref:OLD protein-like TOPRIM domain-containing protein n=1 Tax=Leifsonia williamsii TaxID=3035919 RepID=A0ABT8K810_9MICO|nr:TOPRIM nucleotidyl transferase/hydrolase domain-containing protein [Leifsonia williamsii]MDN4613302.1 hypothetical protein [Leifsonia williamsii]